MLNKFLQSFYKSQKASHGSKQSDHTQTVNRNNKRTAIN